MKLTRFLATLTLLTWTSSAFAADVKKEKIYPMGFTLQASLGEVVPNAEFGLSRSVSVEEGKQVKAIMEVVYSQDGRAFIGFSEFDVLNVGDIASFELVSAEGHVLPLRRYVIDSGGWTWKAEHLFDANSIMWPSGKTKFIATIIHGGVETKTWAYVRVQSGAPVFGPLKKVEISPEGGLQITGTFSGIPVVTVNRSLVEVREADIVRRSDGLSLVTVSAGVLPEGQTVTVTLKDQETGECSTRLLSIPSSNS